MKSFIKSLPLSVFLLLFSIVVSPVFAAFSSNISNINPDTVSDSEQEVTVSITISDLPSESYFRIAWQESSGNPYFGYMKNNNGDWVKIDSSQDCKNYYHVSDLTTESLVIVTKIGKENTDGLSNGPYLLKARRYTASCSSNTDSESISIQVNLPIPTPTPTDIPTPTRTPTPTKTPTPTPTKSQAVTPTIAAKSATPTPSKQAEVLGTSDKESEGAMPSDYPTAVLGTSTEKDTPTPSQKVDQPVITEGASGNNNLITLIFCGVGGVLLITCGILVYLKKRQSNE